MPSKGIILLTLVAATRLLFQRGNSRAIEVIQGKRSIEDFKLDLFRPSVLLGLLCTALVVQISWRLEREIRDNTRNIINLEWVPWVYLGSEVVLCCVGKWIEVNLFGIDEALTPIMDMFIINILFMACFLPFIFLIEKTFSSQAHLSWLIYYIIIVLFIRLF